MDSRLDSIFRTRFRHTEPLDTRQAIRRHDQPDDRGRKHDRAPGKDDQDLWEDQTAVSIRALKVFLRQLVEQEPTPAAGGNPPPAGRAADSTQTGGPAPTPAPTPGAARAARAYQRTYSATHSGGEQDAPRPDALPNIALTPDETRAIHALIADLDRLERQNVEYLNIRKSESFLQSLVDAIAALSAL